MTYAILEATWPEMKVEGIRRIIVERETGIPILVLLAIRFFMIFLLPSHC
jgi:hypothetical protein